jgi:tetratricopeptide (TPR) repeat protein
MSTSSQRPNAVPQPALADLLGQYLHQQATAHQAGLAFADTAGDVIPHEAVAAQPIDPRLAWEGACAAIRYLIPTQDLQSWNVPPDWPALVAAQEPVMALPLCVGNFPQEVRDLSGLFRSAPFTAPVPPTHPASASVGLLSWADKASWKKQRPNPLLAVAALRLAGQYDRAAELLDAHQKDVPEAWNAAWANEMAALSWHRGETDKATRAWQKQVNAAPVLFNRGLAALTAGRMKEARVSLTEAVAQIPESDAWHHLGRLYLTLAELGG